MADGTVRGAFDLDADQPIRDLGRIRDTGREADSMLSQLGSTMDKLGGSTVNQRLDSMASKIDTIGSRSERAAATVSTSWQSMSRSIDDQATQIDTRIDRTAAKVEEFGSMNVSAKISLAGFDTVNAQLSAVEARLDAIGRRSVSARVGVSGGGGGITGGVGGAAGAAERGTPLGRMVGAGALQSAAFPLAVGAAAVGALPLLPSASMAVLGAGTVGLGAAGTAVAGGGLSFIELKQTISALTDVTKAQKTYSAAVAEYGRTSAQATTAKKAFDAALVAHPGSAGPARQLGMLQNTFTRDTRSGRATANRGISQVLYNARRATPQVARDANVATTATTSAAVNFSQFLTDPKEISDLTTLTASFSANLPIAEKSLEHVAGTLSNLAVDAIPFFHEANVWVANWTGGLEKSSTNTRQVQADMTKMVDSARDWAHLTSDVYHTIKDVFSADDGQSGNSMVASLDSSFQRWDDWINKNPQKVQGFFQGIATTVGKVATTIGNLADDIVQIAHLLGPILGRGMDLVSAVSGLGPTGAIAAVAGARGAYSGLTRGRGPSAGAAAATFVTGSSGFATRSMARRRGTSAGSAINGGIMMPASGRRATDAEVESGRLEDGTILAGGATEGPEAVLARRRAAAAGRLAEDEPGMLSRAGGAVRDTLTLSRTRGAISSAAGGARTMFSRGAAGAEARSGLAGAAGDRAVAGLSGAARFLGPTMAITGLLGALEAKGGVLNRVGTGVNQATFGLVPKGVLNSAFGTANAGGSLAAIRPSVNRLNRRLGTASTPGQFENIQASAVSAMETNVGNLSPSDQSKLDLVLSKVGVTAGKDAGDLASKQWQTSFTDGLSRGESPEKAVDLLTTGMTKQLAKLGPQGQKTMLDSTAQWVNTLQKSNPKLAKPLDDFMDTMDAKFSKLQNGAGKTMSGIASNIQYYNGQIYTGTAKQWTQISQSLTDPMLVAQEKLNGTFSTIKQEALAALQAMGYSRSDATTLISAGGTSKKALAFDAASASTANAGQVNAATGAGHARGGMLAGGGLLDTLSMPDGSKAAPGEAWIANRHTMNDLSRATLAHYGKTAWSMIRDEGRPHSAPMRYALGGQVNGTGGGQSHYTRLMDAANKVSAANFPYVWGGGHEQPAKFQPFDCSGTVSYVTQQAGYNVPTTVAGDIGSWGFPAGQGQATIFYNDVHTFMKIGEKYFGTSGFARPGGGAGWFDQQPDTGYLAGFKTAHLPDLGGTNVTAGGGVGGFGSVNLRAPGNGMSGIPGALGNRASKVYAKALSNKINGALAAMGGGGGGNALADGGLSGPVPRQVYEFMRAAGFNRTAVAGELGNAMQESSMNPSTPGGGLWQQISNFGSGTGGSLLHQMQTMLPQIEGIREAMNSAGSPGAAAQIFEQQFERAGIPAMANRIAYANQAYSQGYERGGGPIKWGGWHRKGTDQVTNGPTIFGAGEGGRKERVQITPVGSSSTGRAGGNRITVVFKDAKINASRSEMKEIGEMVAESILEALDAGNGTTDDELMGAPS